MANNNDDIIKRILAHAKPDHAMMLEGIKKANETITMLSNELRQCQARSQEYWLIIATILHSFGGTVVLMPEDRIQLDPISYRITIEPRLEDDARVVRLRVGGAEGD